MMMGFRRALLGLLIAASSLGAAGCRPDFAPFNRLTALRVLGIQAEPPTPAIGESTTLSALVFTPDPDPTLTYHWTWCPLAAPSSDGYQCLVTEADLAAYVTSGLPPFPAFDLGTGQTATFTNGIDPMVFDFVCNNMLPNVPTMNTIDCSAGFSTQVTLTVTTATDSVTAVQNLKLRRDGTTPANANPAITAVNAALGSAYAPVDDTGAVILQRDVETPLSVTIDPSVAEVYPDPSNDNAPTTERLFATWFVETGDTHDQRTSYIAGSTSFGDLLKNSWTPANARNYPSPTARIFVVLHDNRGGAAWTGGTVTLGASP
jgi:hypothetical protein